MKKKLSVFSIIFLILLNEAWCNTGLKPFITMGPVLLFNTDSKINSAPSPVMYSIGAGTTYSFTDKITGEGKVSFFTNYYLWDEKNAQPSEVENRTATVLSFMFDFTAKYNFVSGKNYFTPGLGLGFNTRFAVLSNNVSSAEKEYVKKINSWLWSDFRYLYPKLSFTYLRQINDKVKAGFDTNVYFNMASLTKSGSFDEMLFSAALRLQL